MLSTSSTLAPTLRRTASQALTMDTLQGMHDCMYIINIIGGTPGPSKAVVFSFMCTCSYGLKNQQNPALPGESLIYALM